MVFSGKFVRDLPPCRKWCKNVKYIIKRMQGLGTRKSCGDDAEFERNEGNNTIEIIIGKYGKSRHLNDTIWHCVRAESFIFL